MHFFNICWITIKNVLKKYHRKEVLTTFYSMGCFLLLGRHWMTFPGNCPLSYFTKILVYFRPLRSPLPGDASFPPKGGIPPGWEPRCRKGYGDGSWHKQHLFANCGASLRPGFKLNVVLLLYLIYLSIFKLFYVILWDKKMKKTFLILSRTYNPVWCQPGIPFLSPSLKFFASGKPL